METALFSAAVAFLVFVWTQVWTTCRADVQFRKQKLEELISSLRGMLYPISVPAADDGKEIATQLQETLNASSIPELLIRLYFPELSESFATVQKQHSQFISELRDSWTRGKLLVQIESVKKLTGAVNDTIEIAIQNSNDLTKSGFRRFVAKLLE